MNAWPDVDCGAISRHLRQLRLRTSHTVRVYRGLLAGFQRLAEQRACGGTVDLAIVEEWVRERARRCKENHLAGHARVVDRFLDFLADEGLIVANPLARLRAQYGLRATPPIIRALLSADPHKALEAVRRPPPFASFLGDFLRGHAELMRALGRQYRTQTGRFLRFDRFLQGRPDLASSPPAELLRQWTAEHPTTSHAYQCQLLRNDLARAWRRLDPDVTLPRPDRRLWRRIERRQPHVFTPVEVRHLLDTALQWPSPRAALRPLTLYTMLVLAYCAGLRLGEIVHLDLGDVDLDRGQIAIRNTKFFKSRTLPLAPSVVEALRVFVGARHAAGAPQLESSGLFWHEQRAGRYSDSMAEKLLVKVMRNAGLKARTGRVGPRIHDLRHSFVANRMLAWYREGINPQQRLPYLATYLGHKDIHSTLVYLTVTQELLQQASERFRAFAAHALRADEGVPS
jgi:integrase/recombinase XerD